VTSRRRPGQARRLAKSPGEWRDRSSLVYSRSAKVALVRWSCGDLAHLSRDGVSLNPQLHSPSLRTDDARCDFGFTSLPHWVSRVDVRSDRLVNSAFANRQTGLRRCGRLSVVDLMRGKGISVDGLSPRLQPPPPRLVLSLTVPIHGDVDG